MTQTLIDQMSKKNEVVKSLIDNMNEQIDTIIAQQQLMLDFVYQNQLLSVVQT